MLSSPSAINYYDLRTVKRNTVRLVAFFLITFGSSIALGVPFLQDGSPQGVVSMEAESFHASVVAPDGHEWLPAGTNFPGFSGTDALQALPEDSVNYSTGYSTLSPQLDYQVNFVAAGTHYVWVRAWGPSLGSDSVHVGLNNQELATGENMTVPTVAGYVWISQVALGGSATLTIATAGEHTVNVWANETGTVIDKVVLTTDPVYDPSALNGGLGPTESVQINPTDVDLSVALIVDDGGPLKGTTVVYTVTVTNQGPAVATGVVLTDQLPAGLTYMSDDATSTSTLYDSGSGVWTVGTVLAGQAVSLSLAASVDANTVGDTLTNTASVSGLNEVDPVPGNNSASVSVTVVDLSVSQAVDNASPFEGTMVVYTVSVTNQSLVVATGMALTDLLPVGLTYVNDDAASTGTLYDSGSGVWTVGTVLAGQTMSLNLTASVDANIVGTTLTNTASMSGLNEMDPVPGNDIASVSVTVVNVNSVDLSVSQMVDDASTPSTVITDIVFDMSTLKNVTPGNGVSAPESDNWPITWSGNDHQYTAFGDGKGFSTFNTTRASLGISRIEGSKDNHSAFDIFKTGSTSGGWGGKSLGILALDTDLYMLRSGTGSNSGAYEQTELYHSTDNGFSWDYTGVRWLRNESPGIDGFFSPTFLQFGKGYAGARDNFVYIYANEITTSVGPSSWNVQLPGRISLLRVPKASLIDKSAYQYFAGLDTSNIPVWSTSSSARKPVFSDDINGIMRTSVSYNAGLGRYILTTQQVSRQQADNYRIGIYEAPEPWGPWRTVLFANPVDVGPGLNLGSKTVYWNFSNKWLSSDGREFVMVYTGPGKDELGTVEGRFVTSLKEGTTVVYTVTVKNQGLAVATGVVLTDQLQAGLTYVGDDAASTGTFYDSGSGVWTVGTVLAGQAVSLSLAASVDANTVGDTLTNTASVSGLNEVDPVPGNNSASVSVMVVMVVMPNGDINGDGQVNAVDVLLAQRIVFGLYTPTAAEFQRGDVAPLINGIPSPNAEMNAGDLLLIQRKALGLTNF